MSIDKLYKGIAFIIDDAIGTEFESADGIGEIIKKIERKGIPCCKSRTLPDDSVISNLQSVNFILLDWWLHPSEFPQDKEIPPGLAQEIIKQNIEFLKKVKNECFTPVFIFTRENEKDVIAELKKETGLYDEEDESRNFIFIRKKEELIKNDSLFKEIESWISNNLAVYTLKMWDAAFYEAKNSSFWHLFNRSPIWPKILWKTFSDDLINEDSNMIDAVYRLIKARMPLVEFDRSLICLVDEASLNISEIKEVIQGIMYLDKEKIPENDLQPGDIFKIGGDYYLNIRPVCDTVLGRAGCDREFYAIKGNKISKPALKKRYDKELTLIIEQENEIILYGVESKDFVMFSLKKIEKLNYDDKSERRIARLLPPYVNHVQQKYSHYVSRVGLPRLPAEIIKAAVT